MIRIDNQRPWNIVTTLTSAGKKAIEYGMYHAGEGHSTAKNITIREKSTSTPPALPVIKEQKQAPNLAM